MPSLFRPISDSAQQLQYTDVSQKVAVDLRIGRRHIHNSKTLHAHLQYSYRSPNSRRGYATRWPIILLIQAFKPPKSKEEKELELEAVQQRLLEEANSKRNAAIQQLRATFQRAPSTLAFSPAALSLFRVSHVVSMSLRLTKSQYNRDTELALSPDIFLAPSLTVLYVYQARLAQMTRCSCRGRWGYQSRFGRKPEPRVRSFRLTCLAYASSCPNRGTSVLMLPFLRPVVHST